MAKNRTARPSGPTIILREYKKEQIILPLQDLCFLRKKERNVTAFTTSGRQVNLYCRHISYIRKLIENQNLQNHFYINTRIIVSYLFIEFILSNYPTIEERLVRFKSAGLGIGRNEYLKIKNAYDNLLI